MGVRVSVSVRDLQDVLSLCSLAVSTKSGDEFLGHKGALEGAVRSFHGTHVFG